VSSASHLEEFRALRYTIAQRGTTRVVLQCAGLLAWAAALLAVLVWLPVPVAAAIPLLILIATFEAGRTLHLGVERIGRYLQVFHEADSARGDAAQWEHVVMAMGPRVPGVGGHPLGLPLFAMATVVNGLAVVLPGPQMIEWATMLVPHVAFVAWMLVCDRRMRAQRATELKAFQQLRSREVLPGPRVPSPEPRS
jgi:hypothetical protein